MSRHLGQILASSRHPDRDAREEGDSAALLGPWHGVDSTAGGAGRYRRALHLTPDRVGWIGVLQRGKNFFSKKEVLL